MNKEYRQYPDGGVYWARIKLEQQADGVLFTSPVDGATHLVKGATLEVIKGQWWNSDFHSGILDAIGEMGGCRWVLGYTTDYDYYEEEGEHYLEVMENGRQMEEAL
jgi:hypothetical protein